MYSEPLFNGGDEDVDIELPYDDVPQTQTESEQAQTDLRSRIGRAKVYLLSESSAALHGRLVAKVRSRPLQHDRSDASLILSAGSSLTL